MRAATGLPFTRLVDTTQRNFAEWLRRERGLGHPVELLHLALPVSAGGDPFADGWADGNWLSERLQGVRVLLLRGRPGRLGDWLGVVPHVDHAERGDRAEDAAVLTQHFWQGIGLGRSRGWRWRRRWGTARRRWGSMWCGIGRYAPGSPPDQQGYCKDDPGTHRRVC